MSAHRSPALAGSHFRKLLLVGTALPVIIGSAASAQTVTRDETSDVEVNQASASGAPVAVQLRSREGSVRAAIDAVTATSVAGQRDHVIYATTDMFGDVDLTLGTVTATGSGEILGVEVETGGNITVDVGSMDLEGAATAGVFAYSGYGSIALSADSIRLRGTGYDSQGQFAPDGLVAIADNGSTSITAGTIETDGLYGSAIATISGGMATVVVDTAITTGDGGATILAEAAGDVSVTAGTTRQEGDNAAAIQAISNGGMTTIAAENVYAGDLASGIYAFGVTGASVTAANVDAGGQAIRAVSNSGPATIEITGDVTSRYSNAISVAANGADVTIAEGATVHSNGGTAAIAINGRGGDVAITSEGAIVVGGAGESGIGVTTGGDIGISVASIDVASDVAPTSGFHSGGISAVSNAGGSIVVDAGSVTVQGEGRSGIHLEAIGDGTIDLHVEEVSNSADDHATVRLASEAGDITLTGGTVLASGEAGIGVYATSVDGDISVALDEVVTTGLGSVNDHFSEGVLAETANGVATVDVGSSSVNGYAASALIAIGGAGASVTYDNAMAAGADGQAILSSSDRGDATVVGGTLVTTGDNSGGIAAIAINGVAAVMSESVDAQGVFSGAILASGAAGASVVSGDAQGERYAIYASGRGTGDVSITTTGTTESAGYAIEGVGRNVAIETAADSVTTGGIYGIIATAQEAVTITNDGTINATGGLATAIRVTAPGAITIDSNIIAVTGAGAFPGADGSGMRLPQGGIVVNGGDGPVEVTSNSMTIEGEHRYGIHIAANGPITVDAGDITLASADSLAVAARGGAGDVSVTSGTIITTGPSGAGVLGSATTGNVSIVADVTDVRNAGLAGPFTGDAVVGISDSGNVSVVSNDARSAGLYGSAVVAIGGGSASIESTTATTTGDGGVAVYASAGTGDATVDAGLVTATGADGLGIYAVSRDAAAVVQAETVDARGSGMVGIWASGATRASVEAGDITADAAAIIAQAAGGTAEINILGEVVSLNDDAIRLNSAEGVVEVAEGASAEGALAGIRLAGGTASLDNAGTITGGSDAAIVSDAAGARIVNDGTIVAGSAEAIRLGGGDDSVVLRRNSAITGLVDTGAGIDRVELSFVEGQQGVGSVAEFANAEILDIASGAWRAETGYSLFAQVNVAEDAELTVAQVDGYAALIAPQIDLAGSLVLDFDTDTEPGDLSGLVIAGTGSVRLVGDATILVDDASGLQHSGGTFVEDGVLLLTDALVGDVATSGEGVLQIGDGGTSGGLEGDLVNDGRLIYARSDDYLFAGSFTGTGALDKYGEGTLTFGGFYGFTGVTSIHGGAVRFTGQLDDDTSIDLTEGTLDLSEVSGGEQTIAELSGSPEGEVQLGGTILTVDQQTNTEFGGSISGTGGIVKEGDGELDLTGDSDYTGDTVVNGGLLTVNGSIRLSELTVNSGGALGGNGTVGNTAVAGGTLTPGNSIGRLTVDGDLVLTADSVFVVEANAAGEADRVDATGSAALGGATVSVLAEAGRYRGRTDYTILTAAEGIDGTFGAVTSNLAFLTPSLAYSDTAVTLSLTRNDIAFAAMGANANQAAIGTAIESLGALNPLFEETLLLADTQVSPDFESLTGEIYPSLSSALVGDADLLRRDALSRTAPGIGAYAWANAIGQWQNAKASDDHARYEQDAAGFSVGLGYAANGFDASLGIGEIDADGTGLGNADRKVRFVGGQIGWTGDEGLVARAGVQIGWADGNVTRRTSLGAIDDALRGHSESDFTQFYGQVGYRIPTGALAVEPFAGLSHVSVNNDAVQEIGGDTALEVAEFDQKVTFSTLGVQLSADPAAVWQPRASIGWRHGWGDLTPTAPVSIDGSQQVGITGIAAAGDAADLGLGVGYVSGRFGIDVGYDGSFSDRWTSHAARARISVRF